MEYDNRKIVNNVPPLPDAVREMTGTEMPAADCAVQAATVHSALRARASRLRHEARCLDSLADSLPVRIHHEADQAIRDLLSRSSTR